MSKANDSKISNTGASPSAEQVLTNEYPRAEIEGYTVRTAEHQEIVVNLRPHGDMEGPTEAVNGAHTAKGAVVWVALAPDDDVESGDGAEHYVTVDAMPTKMSALEVLGQAIERLTIAREQLAHLQG